MEKNDWASFQIEVAAGSSCSTDTLEARPARQGRLAVDRHRPRGSPIDAAGRDGRYFPQLEGSFCPMRASSIDSSRRSSISETKMKFSGRALFRRTGRRTTCPPEIAISDGINENFESSIDLSVL